MAKVTNPEFPSEPPLQAMPVADTMRPIVEVVEPRIGMVSGCFDPLHAGHIEFFAQAKRLCNELIVVCAHDNTLIRVKGRLSSVPQRERAYLLSGIKHVDRVVLANDHDPAYMNFHQAWTRYGPCRLVVNYDDPHIQAKVDVVGIDRIAIMPRKPSPGIQAVSSSMMVQRLQAPKIVPLRVDFFGGWLDVANKNPDGMGYVCNMAITPGAALASTATQDIGAFPEKSGLGTSAAWAMLNGHDPYHFDKAHGCGWQDPAVIEETGLCVWHGGPTARLISKSSGELLRGLLAVFDTGVRERENIAGLSRNIPVTASHTMSLVPDVLKNMHGVSGYVMLLLDALARGMHTTYKAQLQEGMRTLAKTPAGRLITQRNARAVKYLGAGHGGYAVVLFTDSHERDMFVINVPSAVAVEPYLRGGELLPWPVR